MKPGWRLTILGAVAMASLLRVACASGQAGPAQKPLMAEDVFKNVQVLKGISVDEFMGTMGFYCRLAEHELYRLPYRGSASDVARFADDTPVKQTARKMILMVKTINANNFGGVREVTCYSCHRGSDRPKVTPSLAEQYEHSAPGRSRRI